MKTKKFLLFLFFLLILVISAGCLQSSRDSNPELCEKVSLQEKKDDCFRGVAFSENNPDFCDKISDLNTRDDCYIDLAVGRNFFID